MKFKFLTALAICGLLFTACTDDGDGDENVDFPVALSYDGVADVSEIQIFTKTLSEIVEVTVTEALLSRVDESNIYDDLDDASTLNSLILDTDSTATATLDGEVTAMTYTKSGDVFSFLIPSDFGELTIIANGTEADMKIPSQAMSQKTVDFGVFSFEGICESTFNPCFEDPVDLMQEMLSVGDTAAIQTFNRVYSN